MVRFNEKAALKSLPKRVSEAPNYVHPFHHNFNMVLNIMLGIKKSVDSTFNLPMY